MARSIKKSEHDSKHFLSVSPQLLFITSQKTNEKSIWKIRETPRWEALKNTCRSCRQIFQESARLATLYAGDSRIARPDSDNSLFTWPIERLNTDILYFACRTGRKSELVYFNTKKTKQKKKNESFELYLFFTFPSHTQHFSVKQ